MELITISTAVIVVQYLLTAVLETKYAAVAERVISKAWLYLVNGFIFLLFVLALASTGLAVAYLSHPEQYSIWAIITVFWLSLLSWAVFFHVIAYHRGAKWKSRKVGILAVFWQNWVKTIDYIYLLVSSVSILRIALSSIPTDVNLQMKEGMQYYNAFAVVALGAALALRITRTSVEIFKWDEPR